ncbi:MAG TPA: penicillin-binding protein activator [Nevskiaceae bacterium]
MSRAQRLYKAGQPIAATETLVRRATLLHDAEQAATNRRTIWDSLRKASLEPASLTGLETANRTTRGWIELAKLARSHADLEQYTRWQASYRGHPATPLLPELLLAATTSKRAPTSATMNASPFPLPPVGRGPIALLLPLNGPLAGAAKAVQQGVESVLAQAGLGAPRIFDVTDAGQSAESAMSQAVNAGAALIIGPLRKPAVALLNLQGNLSVPLIALNYLELGARPTTGLLQFGLSPDDEAREAAEDATTRGLHDAVALVPEGARGDALLAAFERELTARGGSLLASRRYAGGTRDFSAPIRQLMVADAAPARSEASANAMARDADVQARLRPDIDFIFISGSMTADRMMVATFRYWHADRTPIYATSEARSPRGDQDLAAVRFCTGPWTIADGSGWEAIRARLSTQTGGATPLEPLFAMGADAARLALAVRVGALQPGTKLAGYTGELVVRDDGVVTRRLTCAENTLGGPPRTLSGPTPALPLLDTAPGAPISAVPPFGDTSSTAEAIRREISWRPATMSDPASVSSEG